MHDSWFLFFSILPFALAMALLISIVPNPLWRNPALAWANKTPIHKLLFSLLVIAILAPLEWLLSGGKR